MGDQRGEGPAGRGGETPEANSDAVPPGTPNSGENICRRCGGTGRAGDQPCPECGGSGKVITPIGGAG